MIAAKADGGDPAALCGILAAGAVLFVIGLLVNAFGSHWINVADAARRHRCGRRPDRPQPGPGRLGQFQEQPLTAMITLTVIVLATVRLPGFFGRISILLGVVVGLLRRLAAGPAADSRPRGTPRAGSGCPDFTTPTFSWTAIGLIVPVVVVLIAENTGHIKAVGHDDRPQPGPVAGPRLHG